jgi:hypothetical protein
MRGCLLFVLKTATWLTRSHSDTANYQDVALNGADRVRIAVAIKIPLLRS